MKHLNQELKDNEMIKAHDQWITDVEQSGIPSWMRMWYE